MGHYSLGEDIPIVTPFGVPGGPVFGYIAPSEPSAPTPPAAVMNFNFKFSLRGGPYERNWIFAAFNKYFNMGDIYDQEE